MAWLTDRPGHPATTREFVSRDEMVAGVAPWLREWYTTEYAGPAA